MARAVQAPVYLDKGMFTCNYYSYWSGVPIEGVELYSRPGRTIVVDKTNHINRVIEASALKPAA